MARRRATINRQVSRPRPPRRPPMTPAQELSMSADKRASAAYTAPGGAGAPPGPGAQPITAYSAPPPTDPLYQRQSGDIATSEANQQAAIAADRQRATYGFNDPTNPFNQLKMLERNFQQAARARKNSMASAGHLYSGALERGLGDDRFGYDRDVGSATTAYQNAQARFTEQSTGVGDQARERRTGAYGEMIGRQVADPAPQSEPAGAPAANARKNAVLAKLRTHISPATRARLRAEARAAGWI